MISVSNKNQNKKYTLFLVNDVVKKADSVLDKNYKISIFIFVGVVALVCTCLCECDNELKTASSFLKIHFLRKLEVLYFFLEKKNKKTKQLNLQLLDFLNIFFLFKD